MWQQMSPGSGLWKPGVFMLVPEGVIPGLGSLCRERRSLLAIRLEAMDYEVGVVAAHGSELVVHGGADFSGWDRAGETWICPGRGICSRDVADERLPSEFIFDIGHLRKDLRIGPIFRYLHIWKIKDAWSNRQNVRIDDEYAYHTITKYPGGRASRVSLWSGKGASVRDEAGTRL